MSIHGLFIGNDYRGYPYELPDCELDARNVCAALKPFCTSAVVLTGSQASRLGIFHAASRVKATLKRGDKWILSNSGHGTRVSQNGKWIEAVVCHGGELIFDYEMDELLGDERPQGSGVAVLSDSCHSGGLPRAFFASSGIRRTISADELIVHRATPPKRKRRMEGVIYFSGCRANEESFSTGHGGALTLAILQALKERKAGQTFAELFQRVGGKGGLLPTDEYPQHPQCFGAEADLARSLESFVN